MKTNTKRFELANIFLVIFCFGLSFVAVGQVTPQNRVIVVPSAKTTPTPSQTPIIAPTVTPTPLVTPSIAPTPAPVQTLPELQTKIRTILARPALMRGRIGIKVI
jgi:hypothetical protein